MTISVYCRTKIRTAAGVSSCILFAVFKLHLRSMPILRENSPAQKPFPHFIVDPCMNALVFKEPGEIGHVLHLENIDAPGISPTQVLVEVKARPVNPSDIYFIRGVYRKKPVYP